MLFADDETYELIDHISGKFNFSGGVQDYEELDDGTVIVAVADTDFDAEGSFSEEEDIKAARKSVEDGDVFGIIHYDRKAVQIDSIWGMVGYGGAKKAIAAYKADYYTHSPLPSQVLKPGLPVQPTAAVPTPPPVRLSQPGDELSANEDRFIGWMLQHNWYDKRSDAIAHVERMRRAGTRIPGTLQGVPRRGLFHWPGLRR